MEKIIGVLLVVSAVVTLYFSFFNDSKIFIG